MKNKTPTIRALEAYDGLPALGWKRTFYLAVLKVIDRQTHDQVCRMLQFEHVKSFLDDTAWDMVRRMRVSDTEDKRQ